MKTKYAWEVAYLAAITETDCGKLPELIQQARAKIDERIREFVLEEHAEERETISKALYAMRLLWIERCEGVDPRSE
jgi:hypothetical protein